MLNFCMAIKVDIYGMPCLARWSKLWNDWVAKNHCWSFKHNLFWPFIDKNGARVACFLFVSLVGHLGDTVSGL